MNTLARINDLEIRLYKLTTKSHLRVGAGEGSAAISAVDNPIIMALIYDEDKGEDKRVPYIPASSLHGVIRSWVEKVLRSKNNPLPWDDLKNKLGYEGARTQAGKDFKNLLGGPPKEPASEGIEAEYQQKITDYENRLFAYWQVYPEVCDPLLDVYRCEIVSDDAKSWKREWIEQTIGRKIPCKVCSIFGYMGQRGRIRLTHAFPTKEELPLDIITRVAINRLTGAADEGKLFDLEAIPPGVTLYFFVIMENMKDEEKKRFDKGLRALNLQLASLGAHSTIGFGMVDVKQVYAANIKPGIFDLNPPVEEIINEILKEDSGYILRENLDKSKYPQFFLALSSIKEGLPDEFKNQVEFRKVEKEKA